MANNKRTIYLGLDYSQFSGGITEVNSKMSLLDAEFKKAQQEAKNYGTETDALAVKQDYLSQKLVLQQQRVDAARKKLEEASSTTNTSQKTIDRYTERLIKEETQLEKLRGQLKDTDEEQKRLNKDSETFGDTIRSVAQMIGADSVPAVEKLASKFDGLNKNVGLTLTVVAGFTSKLVDLSKNFAKTSDDLLTLSSVTNISTEELQKLQYASEYVDVSVSTMTDSITRLTRNMDSARDGNKNLEESFRKLHIRITDGNGRLRDSNQVFYQAIDALGAVRNETERDALAMEIFGKSAKELNPLIEAGSKRLRELGIEAEDLGRILSDEELAEGGALSDALQRMSDASDSLKLKLGIVLAPILEHIADIIGGIPTPALQIITVIAGMMAAIVPLISMLKSLSAVMTATTAISAALGTASGKLTLEVIGVVAAVAALIAVLGILFGKKDDLNSAMENVGRTVSNVQDQITNVGNTTNTYNTRRNASGNKNFQGGRTWVGEEGPELVTLPGGSSIEPIRNSEYNVFNITIDAKNVDDFNRVVQIVNGQKMALRRS